MSDMPISMTGLLRRLAKDCTDKAAQASGIERRYMRVVARYNPRSKKINLTASKPNIMHTRDKPHTVWFSHEPQTIRKDDGSFITVRRGSTLANTGDAIFFNEGAGFLEKSIEGHAFINPATNLAYTDFVHRATRAHTVRPAVYKWSALHFVSRELIDSYFEAFYLSEVYRR